ncbi:MAG: Coq4 family protein [Nitrosarchaeum sp.]
MGYMDLMTKAENLEKLRELVNTQVKATPESSLRTVFDLEDGFRDTIWMKACIAKIKSDPASAKILEERYVEPEWNLVEMLKLPKNSLGWTYAKVMSTLGYDPHFYRDRKSIEEETDYVTMRVRSTHDMMHIISGFDMIHGEIATIGLNVGQYGYPGFMLIDLMGLFFACFPLMEGKSMSVNTEAYARPDVKRTGGLIFDILAHGITMARKAKPLFAVKLGEILDQPLDKVRKDLNIEPITFGDYSWYSDPRLKDAVTK